jgi:hypothetical protein
MLSVIYAESYFMLSVSMMNVVAPLITHYGKLECLSLQKLVILVIGNICNL